MKTLSVVVSEAYTRRFEGVPLCSPDAIRSWSNCDTELRGG